MKPRGDFVRGCTYRVQLAHEGLYVTVNEDGEGAPFEVFVTIGKSGGFTASFTETIGRLVSLCLRSGVPLPDIARQLVGVRGPQSTRGFWSGFEVLSVPDAIGRVLLKHARVEAPADAVPVPEEEE